MPQCPHCGGELSGEEVVCPHCLARLSTAPAESKAAEAPRQPKTRFRPVEVRFPEEAEPPAGHGVRPERRRAPLFRDDEEAAKTISGTQAAPTIRRAVRGRRAAPPPRTIVLSGRLGRLWWLALLALLSLWLVYEAWQRGGWWWAGYALTAAALVYTHNWGLLLWACQNGFVLWMALRRRPPIRRLVPWGISQIAVGLLYLPWFFVLLRQIPIIAVLPFVPVPSPAEKLAQLAGDLLAPWPMLLLWLALLAWGLWPAKPQPVPPKGEGALAVVIFSSVGVLFVGLLVSLRTYGQVPSYVTMVAFPALCLLVGRGLAGVRPAWLALPAGILLVFFSLQGLSRAQFLFRSTLREVAMTVEQRSGPADVILIAPDYLATTFNVYYHGGQPQVAFPWTMGRLEEIDCVGWNDRWMRAAEAVPATLEVVEERLGAGGRLWLITALDEFPEDEAYYGQVRRLKQLLDERYLLVESIRRFRSGMEWADIYVYRRRGD